MITDAQVEVAEGAYWAVLCSHDYGEKVRPVPPGREAMRAALEAYERVRDLDRILSPETVDIIHDKVRKEYPL